MLNETEVDKLINNLKQQIQDLKDEVVKYKYDNLTGLPMRTDFKEDLKRMFDGNEAFYLIIADVNGLKNANTKNGYNEGDELIKKCVKDLINCNPCGTKNIYRYSGDEFVILFPFNRGFHSEDFHCPSDEFTVATKCSSDYKTSDNLFNACNKLLLERKEEFYNKNPNNRRIN